jgi:hypothetical protein
LGKDEFKPASIDTKNAGEMTIAETAPNSTSSKLTLALRSQTVRISRFGVFEF